MWLGSEALLARLPRPAAQTLSAACFPGEELLRAGLGADLEKEWPF